MKKEIIEDLKRYDRHQKKADIVEHQIKLAIYSIVQEYHDEEPGQFKEEDVIRFVKIAGSFIKEVGRITKDTLKYIVHNY